MLNAKRTDCHHPFFYTVFSTAWGFVGAVAGEGGICRVLLPGYEENELVELIEGQYAHAQRDETFFETFTADCRAYFQGRPVDFSAVDCQLPRADSFDGKVHRACRSIPPGQTRSYGELARQIGCPSASRALAGALGRNRVPLLVPCHRVICSTGKPGGFSASGGQARKIQLLKLEKTF